MKHKKRKVSCLGILLIACMLLIAGCTVSINLMFRNNNAPEILGKRYCYYTEGDMGDRIPAGEVVIAEKAEHINTQDIVLYQSISGAYRIAVASLIVETQSNVPDQSGATYYLTTVTNTTAVEIPAERIMGICKQRSPQLGVMVGFLTSLTGICVGLVLPCVILTLYLIAVIVSSREAKEELNDDEEPDLAFVKSIQKKQQAIAERDAERMAQQNSTSAYSASRRLTEEEIARQEEEEAARRAERIAAVRSHMEQRRQTETPDGVPLYTTEIITKTHTMPIPKTGEKTQPAPQPVPTPPKDIPRLTDTGSVTVPTQEQLEAEEREEQEARMRKAQELARAAQDEFFAAAEQSETAEEFAPDTADETEEPEQYEEETENNVSARTEQDSRLRKFYGYGHMEPNVPAQQEEPEEPAAEETTKEPAAEEPAAEEATEEPVAEETAAEPETLPEQAAPAPEQPAPAAPAAPAAAAPQEPARIASASFDDLMAFLNSEQKRMKS